MLSFCPLYFLFFERLLCRWLTHEELTAIRHHCQLHLVFRRKLKTYIFKLSCPKIIQFLLTRLCFTPAYRSLGVSLTVASLIFLM